MRMARNVIVKSSVLYLIDTVNRQLAVYQGSGGTGSMESIRLVGEELLPRIGS